MEMADPESSQRKRVSILGWIGLCVAFLALGSAVLSPWIIETLDPPKPIEEVAVDKAVEIKNRLKAKLSGKQYQPEKDSESPRHSRWVFPSVIALGVISIGFGLVGFVRRDDLRVSGTTTALGISAILFLYFLIIAGAVLLILLIGVVLAAIMGGT